jgi:hypothetical protein
MTKAKRNRYGSEFKAKVALEAISEPWNGIFSRRYGASIRKKAARRSG